MKKGVIIQGSARSIGNTNKIVNLLANKLNFAIIDLNQKNIGQYDYENKNSSDDFLPTIREIIENYDTIIFATPVYWYSMSGIMKAFFDRITELLKTEKELGRKLRMKNMAMVSCGSDHILQEGFTMPFFETANYLGMNYVGDVHTWVENDSVPEIVISSIEEFSEKIKASIA